MNSEQRTQRTQHISIIRKEGKVSRGSVAGLWRTSATSPWSEMLDEDSCCMSCNRDPKKSKVLREGDFLRYDNALPRLTRTYERCGKQWEAVESSGM